MHINFSSATFLFSPVKGLSLKEREVRELLAPDYPECVPMGIPNDAPAEIPRFLLKSHHGYSNLSISPNLVQFSTRFDEEFSSNWKEKCKGYLENKTGIVFKLIPKVFSKMLFCGLTLTVTFDTDSEAVSVIQKQHLRQMFISNLSLYDVEIKQTYEYLGKYYVNMQLQNQRVRQNTPNMFAPGTLSSLEQKKTVGIVIDLNDRAAANYVPGYESSPDEFSQVLALADRIMDGKLADFVTTGKFEL